MTSLFGVNVDLKPLLEKTEQFTEKQTQIITLLQENNSIQTQILSLLQELLASQVNNEKSLSQIKQLLENQK
jgi:hypothetical protein